jgi:hypothetical protein
MKFADMLAKFPRLILLIALIVVWNPAKTAELNLLRPADTSSPRTTLQEFVETVDRIYLRFAEQVNSYGASGRLYLSQETLDRLPEFFERVRDLPYKPGPASQLAGAYRTISSDRTATIYDAFTSGF